MIANIELIHGRLSIECDTVMKYEGFWQVIKDNQMIGIFSVDKVQGWWSVDSTGAKVTYTAFSGATTTALVGEP